MLGKLSTPSVFLTKDKSVKNGHVDGCLCLRVVPGLHLVLVVTGVVFRIIMNAADMILG